MDSNQEALNNLISSIQEKMSSNENNIEKPEEVNNTSSGIDLSALLNTLNGSNSSSNDSKSDSDFSFDPTILFKIQKIMGAMNNNNPKKNLLLSLKPFLRKARQDKIGEYITILNVISMLESFKDKGSD